MTFRRKTGSSKWAPLHRHHNHHRHHQHHCHHRHHRRHYQPCNRFLHPNLQSTLRAYIEVSDYQSSLGHCWLLCMQLQLQKVGGMNYPGKYNRDGEDDNDMWWKSITWKNVTTIMIFTQCQRTYATLEHFTRDLQKKYRDMSLTWWNSGQGKWIWYISPISLMLPNWARFSEYDEYGGCATTCGEIFPSSLR